MPIDYTPLPSNASAYIVLDESYSKNKLYCTKEHFISFDNSNNISENTSLIESKLESNNSNDQDMQNTIKEMSDELPNSADTSFISGSTEYDLSKEFNPQAIWGPILSRLIPNTKHTLAKIISRNIASLSRTEYEEMRVLIEYIMTHPESKARVFELTGFTDKDLEFAEPYFRKYNTRKFFSKLVEIALATSSNGKVSKQVGGLVQFIFETKVINNKEVSDDFKFLFLRNLPSLIEPIWKQYIVDCETQTGICTDEYKTFFDLNFDNILDNNDYDLANSSLNWLQSQGYY